MSVSGYRGSRFEPRQQYVVSSSKILYQHCFSRLSNEMSTRWDNLVKGVQCYEPFGGIALKNHAFSFIHTCHTSVERVNRAIIKEFRNKSKITPTKHPFDVIPIYAYSQPSNLRNILIESNFHILQHPQAIKSVKNRYAKSATSSLQTLRLIFLE